MSMGSAIGSLKTGSSELMYARPESACLAMIGISLPDPSWTICARWSGCSSAYASRRYTSSGRAPNTSSSARASVRSRSNVRGSSSSELWYWNSALMLLSTSSSGASALTKW